VKCAILPFDRGGKGGWMPQGEKGAGTVNGADAAEGQL